MVGQIQSSLFRRPNAFEHIEVSRALISRKTVMALCEQRDALRPLRKTTHAYQLSFDSPLSMSLGPVDCLSWIDPTFSMRSALIPEPGKIILRGGVERQ